MLKSLIERILNSRMYSPEDVAAPPGDDLDTLQDDDSDPKPDSDDNKSDDDDNTDDKELDDEEDDKKDDDEEEDDEDEDKDDKDDKDDEDEDEDEEEDLIPSIKDIKKDYPDLFKKHPEVKNAIFRDQRFSEIVGTPEEAEQAVARSNILAEVEKDLYVDSNPERLLSHMKKTDEASYKKVIFNMVDYLQTKDKELYLEVGALPIKQLLRNAYREGGEKSSLGNAALWIHQFMFGKDAKLSDPVTAEEERKAGGKTQEQKDYEDRLTKLEQKEYNGFKEAVDQSYVTKMDRFLRETLDKDDRLTDWMRDKIVTSALEEIVEQLKNDTRHATAMGSLWRNAKAAGFTNDFKSRIINTALARAKSLAPNIRAKLVNKALGKAKKKVDSKEKDKPESRQREFKRESRSSSSNNGSKKPLTDLDILRS